MEDRPVNQYAISRALRSTMLPGVRAGFGAFRQMSLLGGMSALHPEDVPDVSFSDSDDDVVRKVFEKVRDGFAVDRFLADPQLTQVFVRSCQRLGLKQPAAALCRRLLKLRKTTGGGVFAPTTRREVHPGLVEQFGPAVEYAMVKMSARYGATTDDLIADPELGDKFQLAAENVIPGGTPLQYRLCALQVRKSRHLARKDMSLFDELDPTKVRFHTAGTLKRLKIKSIPSSAGLILLQGVEGPIYLNSYGHLREAASRIAECDIARRISEDNQFLRLDPTSTALRYVETSELPKADLRLWQLKLIAELNPTFNWPLRHAA